MNDDSSSEKAPPDLGAASKATQSVPPLFYFETMSLGGKEVLINHNEQVYRLRVTKNGKLILNK